MYKVVVYVLTLSLLLFFGLPNTTLARVQYESPSSRKEIGKGVWDQKVFNEIKIKVGGSDSERALGCARKEIGKGVHAQKVFNEIKIAVGGSDSVRAHSKDHEIHEYPYVDMVNDAFRYNVGYDDNFHQDGSYQNVEEPARNHSKKFYDLLEGAQSQSQLSLAARLMQNKSHKTAPAMRWHVEHQSKEGEMNHPSDAAEWRYFQEKNPQFAEKPRNVYLGLCTDGFNPFGMSRNHSLWLVILTPYNLPLDGPSTINCLVQFAWKVPSLFIYLMEGRRAGLIVTEDFFLMVIHYRGTKKDFLKGRDASKEYPPESLTGEQVYYERLDGVNPPKTIDVGEKNFLDNIMNTLMSVKGKSKDNIMSRLDIAKFCSRPALHLDSKDGYSSDLASCVDMESDKFSCMKSHDYHVFMKQLLPFIFSELLDCNVHLALSGYILERSFSISYLGSRDCPWTFEQGENYADSSNEADFYGVLNDIIELEYEGMVNLRITLFKCNWYDPKVGRGTRRSHGGVVDVLSSRKYIKYEPFILGGAVGKTGQYWLAELEGDTPTVSDGASRPRELTTEEYTAIFLQSTEKDARGNPYGIGSLKDTLVSGKRKQPGDSSSFQALEKQLKDAHRKTEEQAANNERREFEVATREAEQAPIAAEQKDKLEHLSLVEKYLRQSDPHFLDFMASQSSSAETTEPLSNTLPEKDP
ncbi:putative transposase Ptta/En/Spm plant [Arabidopsis suecica]|uniref:Putative transposase Ptta/En/Spm plant n=1 Tax=Arabidopsis suecica TaxID=45249 RepID=A0A8T2CX57_ARASU|nr:putative transposase Ptta/En/Spm plant [Arabidopsis suecica]